MNPWAKGLARFSAHATYVKDRVTTNTPAVFNCIPQKTESSILNILVQMKKDNKNDYTINFTRKALTYLGKHTSLKEPEAVKILLADLKTSGGYKRNLAIAYNKYAKFYGIEWTMPIYKQPAKNIALPTKEKIQMLIANAGKNLSLKLQLSIETGLRPVELVRLKVKDPDLEHKTVNPTTAKNGSPRTVPMSQNLTTRLTEHIVKRNQTPTDLLFKGTDADHYGKQYRIMRNKLGRQTQRPTNTTNTTLRPEALLLHKKTERHRKPLHRNGSDGSHKTYNDSTIHASAQLQ